MSTEIEKTRRERDQPAAPMARHRQIVHSPEHVAFCDLMLEARKKAGLLAGRIFDDRSNRMTPTHTNKKGARYR